MNSLGLAVLSSIYLAGQAGAHGGHMDKIPEGEAVSDDPIVRLSALALLRPLLTAVSGLHIMDTHINTDCFVWADISDWNGAWGK